MPIFTSLLLTLVASGGGPRQEADHAKRAIELAGGTCVVDSDAPDKPVIEVSFAGKPVTADKLELLSSLPTLRVLDISNCRQLANSDLSVLGSLTQLEILRADGFSNAGASDSTWRVGILMMSSYDRLASYRGGISDRALVAIGKLKNLRELSLVKTRITDEGLKALSSLESLETLDLSRTNVRSPLQLVPTTNLRELRLEFVPVSNEKLKPLANAHKLRKLSLLGCPIGDSTVERLRNHQQMTDLNLWGTQTTDDSVEPLLTLPSLERLNVANTLISVGSMARLAKLSAKLDLRQLLSAHASEPYMARLQTRNGQLTSLNLSPDYMGGEKRQEPLTDDELKLFDGFDSVTSLRLGGTAVTDDGLATIRGFTNLTYLSLSEHVTDAGLAHLRGMKSLERLEFNRSNISFAALCSLFVQGHGKDLSHVLKAGNFRGGRGDYPVIGESGLPDPAPLHQRRFFVGQQIPRMELKRGSSDLEFFDLGGASLTDQHVSELSMQPKTGALFLDDNDLTNASLRSLGSMKQLEVLWVGGKKLTGTGLRHLSELPNLHSLWITDASISDKDLAELVAFPKLFHLNLSGCDISDSAVEHLAACKELQFLIVDRGALSAGSRRQLRRARPGLYIHQSQAIVLAKLRGRKRTKRGLTQGSSRGDQTLGVGTVVPPFEARHIFGDVHFELADSVTSRISFANATDWPDTIRSINVQGITIDAKSANGLSHLKHLESLSLSRSTVAASALSVLSNRPIRHLSLYECTLMDADFGWLKNLQFAKSIGFFRVHFPNGRLPDLPKNIERLDAGQCGLHTIPSLTKQTALEEIDLSYTQVSDSEAEALTSFTSLKRVNLMSTIVSDEAVKKLKTALPNARISARPLPVAIVQEVEPLRQLSVKMRFEKDELTSVDLAKLKPEAWKAAVELLDDYPTLTQMTLGRHTTDDILLQFKHRLKITSLDVRRSSVSNTGLLPWIRSRELTTLHADRTRITDELFADPSRFHSIRRLDLSQTEVSDAVCETIRQIPNLYFLDLSGTKVTDKGLSKLTRFKNLTWMYLDGLSITDASLTAMEDLPKLQLIQFRKTNVTDAGVTEFRKRFPKARVYR